MTNDTLYRTKKNTLLRAMTLLTYPRRKYTVNGKHHYTTLNVKGKLGKGFLSDESEKAA